MDWRDELTDFADTIIVPEGGFGELVTLPNAVEIQAIFDPAPRTVPGRWGHEAGAGAGTEQPGPPTIWARAADASDLEENQIVTARGIDYAVSRIDRTDSDLTRITVRPIR